MEYPEHGPGDESRGAIPIDHGNGASTGKTPLLERRAPRRSLLTAALVGGVALGTVGGSIGGAVVATRVVTRAGASVAPPASNRSATASQASVAPVALNGQTSTIAGNVFRAANNTVVTIIVQATRTGPRGLPSQGQGEGSGIIVDAQGHILTNNHVVAGSTSVQVTFADGSQAQAKVVGTDQGHDLAVVLVPALPSSAKVATLGDSDPVQVGDPVVAIGDPFGLEHSVTDGIISAVNRTYNATGGRELRGLFQTDAPINPGNSGGPLFNSNAQVIGITTAIESPVDGFVGIGFAIPINQAKQLLPQLTAGQTIQTPYMGIGGVTLTAPIAQQQGLSVTKGVLLTQVQPGSPSDKAGLQGGSNANASGIPAGGDVITAIDGHTVNSVEDISAYLDTKHVGDSISVTILRKGQQSNVTVALGAWPSQQSS